MLRLLLILLATPAAAHDWYPLQCCSEKDCRQVSSEQIPWTSGGWSFNGRLIPKDKIQFSPDGRFHICVSGSGDIHCVFVPELGS